jgi:hypothetical protein
VPYAFAHPAAVIPVAKLLGPRAVPSALAIGSMVPDAWYLVPFLERAHAHEGLAALAFCVPAGLLAYAAFHLIFKEPLLALLPRAIAARAAAWTASGLPAVAWLWVIVSLLAGIATHLLWDAFTHSGHFDFVKVMLLPEVPLYRALQHASTVFGSALVARWVWRKLRATPPRPDTAHAPRALRLLALATIALVSGASLFLALDAADGGSLRGPLRAGAVLGVSALGLAAVAFCVAWRLSPRLRAPPRRRARACATARPR